MLIFLDLHSFLEKCYAKEESSQSQIEEKFLEIEQIDSCSKPPKKRKKLTSSKKQQASCQDAMVTLAAKLQVDHFRQVSES